MKYRFVWAAVGLLVACDSSPAEPRCGSGAECPSGVCLATGQCLETDGSAPDGSPADAGIEAAVDAPFDTSLDAPPGTCTPDQNGRIERAEIVIQTGTTVRWAAQQNLPVDTAGTTGAQGRSWDFSAAPGDRDLDLTPTPLEGQWFADSFPSATYAIRLADASDLLGVFQLTDQSLLLRGIVSPTDGASRTEAVYDPPVVVLAFPIEEGATFQTDARVTGVVNGLPVNYRERYESAVDARGEATTPFATFPVLRVRTLLTRTVGFVDTEVRQFSFITECFGTVATVVSEDDEPTVEFSRASELRRMGI
ncbi:MAG: hypothetical protein AAGF12_12215 [Myxococcota bacterium]